MRSVAASSDEDLEGAVERLTDPGLSDWRLLLDRLRATFRAPTYRAATALVLEIARSVEIDIDLRLPGCGDRRSDGHRSGLWFQQMDTPRPQRNRIHIDVTVPHDEAEARVAAALAAGVLVTYRLARSLWVLADPKGTKPVSACGRAGTDSGGPTRSYSATCVQHRMSCVAAHLSVWSLVATAVLA